MKRYLTRKTQRWFSRILSPLDKNALTDAFCSVGLHKGMTVCLHSSLSRFGYIDGGAQTIIDVLLGILGTEGTLLMPSFSTAGSMLTYIDRNEPFNIRETPSKVGHITEVFRSYPEVVRSLHPTNSVIGFGREAENLLRDHDRSLTPFGIDTPYGRFAQLEDSYILMMETHIHSLLHHLQERVDFPNLYLPEERSVTMIDITGATRTMTTKVMRPRIPYFVAIPSKSVDKPDWVILHDFALIFPKSRENNITRLGYCFDGYPKLYRRRHDLENDNILRSVKLSRGEIGLLHVKRFLSILEPELRDMIKRFAECYDPERIANLGLPYF